MSQYTRLDADIDDVLSELESELEAEVSGSGSYCAGWESKREVFSVLAAQQFCRDAYNLAVARFDTVKCSGQKCVLRYNNPDPRDVFLKTLDITVDLSSVPGAVDVWSRVASPHVSSGFLGRIGRPRHYTYSYACPFGLVNFTLLSARML
ncbi:MAG: hypothetical protein ABSB39_01185 [Candidatus Sulfotelmatobacter sp.]|jgi:hypothetical protein